MSVDWMDNFNIYGTDAGNAARMLNGVYAEAAGSLVVDPDPTAGGGLVWKHNSGNLRKVLPAARTTVGVAQRVWYAQLPGAPNVAQVLWSANDVNNVVHCYMKIDPSGNLVVWRNDTGGVQVQIAITANPVIVANAWQHVESKLVLDAAAGSIEVRVLGITVINVSGIRTTSNVAGAVASCQNIVTFCDFNFRTVGQYLKDLIIWNGTGTFNNNFMGSCAVMRAAPDGDVALNWTPSSGATGFNLINEVTPDDDVNYISAPFPAPAAYKCSLSDLPVTVTSVRAVMPIHRSRKTDAGDGNIQVGLISGASTGLGADRPITTAYTYWWDIFDADPNGGVAWSRAAFNALNLQLNRTL